MIDSNKLKLNVHLRMLSSEQGGRKRPIASGYRPNFWIGHVLDGAHDYYDARITLPQDLELAPGEEAFAEIEPALPQHWTNVKVGMKIDVCEGQRVVGTAIVQEVCKIQ